MVKNAVGSFLVALIGVVSLSTNASAASQLTFYGYGYLPSDAHADAVADMQAYSSSCVEIGTTYSSAGSEHYWQATLTAEC
jgi:hypothetical protein